MKIICRTTPQLITLRAVGRGVTSDELMKLKEVVKKQDMWFSMGMKCWCIQKSYPAIGNKIMDILNTLKEAGYVVWIEDLVAFNAAIGQSQVDGTGEGDGVKEGDESRSTQ